MQYWTRTGNWVDIASFLLLCALWALGGLLIVSFGFHLKVREKLITGLASGFLLFIVLSNLLSQILPMTVAYWSSSGILFISGLVLALLSKNRQRLDIGSMLRWPQILILLAVILCFTMILRGLAIFDDYYHLPMISVMATGDIPPHFYLDPSLHLPYHYGLQVFAAGMVRLGGFFPWSAWDISRAIVFGFTVLLAWLWIRRLTGAKLPAYLGTGLLILGGASRWLLLLIPPSLLTRMGANLHMDISGMTAGGNLVSDLVNRWPMDGGGPFPFPYAFASGILEPLNMQLGATGAMWEMTILLLLLLWRPHKVSLAGTLTISLLLASLALSAEHVYAAVFAGLVIVLMIYAILSAVRHRPLKLTLLAPWGIPLAVSAVVALFQGGYITGGFLSLLGRVSGHAYPMVTTDFQGFSLRWPPAVPSGHFGPLSLFDPGQIVISLAEAGPAFILLPLVVIYWSRNLRKGQRLPQALAAGSVLSLLFPVFFRYGLDFDITRLVGAALWLSYALAFPILWLWLVNARQGYRILAGFGYVVAIYAGLVMFAVELIAIPVPQTTYYLKYNESDFARAYWNRLEKNAQILDYYPERAVLLFGRASFAATDVYKRSPTWEELIANPDPVRVASDGYSYVYMDERWWQSLSPQIQAAYDQPCVNLIAEMKLTASEFRNLFSVEACHP
ncbi:MAG: hypothetical protein WAM09_15560 [Anaerolineales bacterium]